MVAPEICSCRKLIWFPNAFLACPKVTFSLPPPKKRRLQQPEDLSDSEARTPSRAEAPAEIGAVTIRCSLPAQNGWGRTEGGLSAQGWRSYGRAPSPQLVPTGPSVHGDLLATLMWAVSLAFLPGARRRHRSDQGGCHKQERRFRSGDSSFTPLCRAAHVGCVPSHTERPDFQPNT